MACESEVFVTPLCRTTTDDKIPNVAKQSGVKETPSVPRGLKAETELTTRTHNDKVVVAEKQVWRRALASSPRGHFAATPRVFEGRRVTFSLATTPITLEGQPSLLLDEVADVAPVVKAHDSAGIAKHMSA